MTQFLPPNLLALFAARDPIPYLPPVTKLRNGKPTHGYTGVGEFLKFFEDPADTPPPTKYETRDERRERKRREKQEQVVYKLEQEIAMWDPYGNERATSEAFKTLFIGRINFDTSESKLKREFESFGPVKKIIVVTYRKSGKPRGYAFVEYEHEIDMHSAYKYADGKKIDEKRVLVDVERGRTVKGWLPRRLGGGLGGTRRGGPEVNVKISGREDQDRDRFRDDKRDDSRSRRRDRERSKERNLSSRKDRSRDRDKNRVEKNRGRIRNRDRDRVDKVDRKRRRTRSRDKAKPEEGVEDRPRKRSRSREKKRHRSRSPDKKREKRDKEGERGDRDRKMIKERFKTEDVDFDQIRVKQEPIDDYPNYDNSFYNGDGSSYMDMKPEPGETGEALPSRSDSVGYNHCAEY